MEVNKIYLGKNLDVLKTFPDNSIDSVVTDPPYGLGKEPNVYEVMKSWVETGYHEIKGKGFMGKEWDSFVPQPIFWKEVYRVLKPGGFVLSFAGTRTYDWMVMAIRFAGFEVRDMIGWLYGSGFPKSLNIGIAIDKLNGVNSKIISNGRSGKSSHAFQSEETTTAGGYEIKEAQNEWQGFGTALKPAIEPIVLARKPVEGTVAENVLKWGVGGLNIDGCRVEFINEEDKGNPKRFQTQNGNGNHGIFNASKDVTSCVGEKGRWPANVIHDGSDEVVRLFPQSDGAGGSTPKSKITGYGKNISDGSYEYFGGDRNTFNSGSGSAARFFYTAKTSQSERNAGLYGFEEERHADRNKDDGVGGDNPRNRTNNARKNIHPTVKPIDLMRYLVRLVTPPNGLCIDPYLGSGTTAIACKLEGFNYIGIEMEEQYYKIAESRIKNCEKDNETIETILANEDVKQVFNIFDFIGEEAGKEERE